MRNAQRLSLALATLCLVGTGCSNATRLDGSGATFPGILYEQWCKDFGSKKGIQIEYQKVGSGKGEQMITQGVVDFAGSDSPNPQQLQEKIGDKGLVFLPVTAGELVIAYNLEGVPKLKLSRKAQADIFLGNITKWDDPEIVKHNPGVDLPKGKEITVVTRQDKSGTSGVFTGYLSAISEEFEKKVGRHQDPNFPVGIKGDGNQGVTAAIQQKSNSLGYVEYGYAKGAKMSMAWLENMEGEFVEPTPKSGQAALAQVELPENLVGFDFKIKGKESYPIVSFTWLMVYKKYDNAKKSAAIKDFVKYCIHDGQKDAEPLGYIPLPASVVSRVEKALAQVGP